MLLCVLAPLWQDSIRRLTLFHRQTYKNHLEYYPPISDNPRRIMICHHCKKEIKLEGPVSRADECPHCAADIHCCLNCLHYDPSMSNRCREPQAEWVPDREKANFCDFFTPNKSASAGTLNKPTANPRDAFDSLFKK